MKKILLILASVGLLALFGVVGNVSAGGLGSQVTSGVEAVGGNSGASLTDGIKNIINMMLYIIGVVAVLVIIYSGIIFVTAAGDSGKIATAKNAILYAVVGLIVAILAYAIVNFVIVQITAQPAKK